jgi:hypothetical protein
VLFVRAPTPACGWSTCFSASTGCSQSSLDSFKMPSVGKNELLAWLGTESGKPCRSLEDLKNGTIILATLTRIFPLLAERRYRVKWHPRFDWEHGLNWESIAQMCQALKLPTELIDRSGLQVSVRHPFHNLESMHDIALYHAAGMPL